MNIHQEVLNRIIEDADILDSEEASLREWLNEQGALPSRRPSKGEVWHQKVSKTLILITESWDEKQSGQYICFSMSQSYADHWGTSISAGWLDGKNPSIKIELYAKNLQAAMERYAKEQIEKARG